MNHLSESPAGSLERDGTSQADRTQAMLNPGYVSIDERTFGDLLLFTRKLAEQLKFHDPSHKEAQPGSMWSDFISKEIKLDDVVAYMQEPEKALPENARLFGRPHFALFLTFLKLLRHAQDQMNTLTGRHLDFYYRDVLRLTQLSGTADSVNLFVELTPETPQLLIPAGTLLDAGSDAAGQDLFYRTNREIVANRAQVAQLSSLYAQSKITGLRKAHQDTDDPTKALLQLLQIALGDGPADESLIAYDGSIVNDSFLTRAKDVIEFVRGVPGVEPSGLFMDNQNDLSDFRTLMQLKQRRERATWQWVEINTILTAVAKARNPSFVWPPGGDDGLLPAVADAFEANWATVWADTPDILTSTPIEGVPLSGNLYEQLETLYEHRSLPQVQAFFQNTLEHISITEFERLMQLLLQIRSDDAEFMQWQEINDLLLETGKRRVGATFALPADDPRNFDENFLAAVGVSTTLDEVSIGFTLAEESVYELYRQRGRQDVQSFIRDKLHFTDDDFETIMRIRMRIKNDWQEIRRILIDAGQAKRPATAASPAVPEVDDVDADGFKTLFDKTLGELTSYFSSLAEINGPESLYKAFRGFEETFFMSAENFLLLISVKDKPFGDAAWELAYAILEEAHQAKEYYDRKQRLREVRLQHLGEGADLGFHALLAFVLGSDTSTQTSESAVQRLKSILNEDDSAILDTVQARVLARQQAPAGETPSEEDLEARDITDSEWEEVYRVLELAQRVLLPQPLAQKVEWLNLYPAKDVTQFSSQLNINARADIPRWKTFGQAQPLVVGNQPSPESFGWAITSPLLALTQGDRTITLTLGLTGDVKAAIADLDPLQAFRFQVSTAKGWVNVTPVPPGTATTGLTFTLKFDKQHDALAALPIEQAIINTPWPILRLMLRAREGEIKDLSHYQSYRQLVLTSVDIAVEVKELVPLYAQNDDTLLDLKKPFEPFGANAIAGARFYLTDPELVHNKLDNITFKITWMGVPSDLTTYYKNYALPEITTPAETVERYKMNIRLIDRKTLVEPVKEATLFRIAETDPNIPTLDLNQNDIPMPIGDAPPLTEALLGEELSAWPRYIEWELLAPGFQHDTYPALAARKSIELAAAVANAVAGGDDVEPDKFQVNPPYTPKIKSLLIDYTASQVITEFGDQYNGSVNRLFHLHPFGYSEFGASADNDIAYLLPQFDYEGELYIGLRDLFPPQNLSLLFQMAEGSAKPDLPPAPVEWSYLSGNRWQPLGEGNLIEDTTNGLINSGIVTFSLDAAKPNTLLAPNLYWLRVAIKQYTDSILDTVAIHTQAIAATSTATSAASSQLYQPLPPASINDFASPIPGVAAIHQPYSSFGGKAAEQPGNFNTRVSERLRHKHRALTIWDYEHLILERFPEIYKAKCLSADAAALGQVDIILIPDIKNNVPFNPFEPKAPANLLAQITTYLAELTPPFATVTVKNATFVPVKVRVAVRFMRGYDKGYHKVLLNQELNRFLAPWAYEEGADIVIGGRIYANVIVNFIEERPYVDYVAQITLFRDNVLKPRPQGEMAIEGYWVEAQEEYVVLVGALQHEIDLVPDSGYVEQVFSGINYMKIELDFIVG